MSTPELNAVPSWRTIASTQLRMLTILQKRDFVALGAIVALLVALAIWGIAHVTPGSQSGNHGTFLAFSLLAIPFVIVGALWPLGVWRLESPDTRGYFWSLPAPRGPHTLVRFAAGWVLLMAACLAAMVVTLALIVASQIRVGPVQLSFSLWYVPLATATLAYVIVSSLAVLVDSPVRVLAWTIVAVAGVRIVAQVTELKAVARPIDTVVSSLGQALAGPLSTGGPELVIDSTPYTLAFATWATSYLIWFLVGVSGLLFAAFRFKDGR